MRQRSVNENVSTRGALNRGPISCRDGQSLQYDSLEGAGYEYEMARMKVANFWPFVLSHLECDFHHKLTNARMRRVCYKFYKDL